MPHKYLTFAGWHIVPSTLDEWKHKRMRSHSNALFVVGQYNKHKTLGFLHQFVHPLLHPRLVPAAAFCTQPILSYYVGGSWLVKPHERLHWLDDDDNDDNDSENDLQTTLEFGMQSSSCSHEHWWSTPPIVVVVVACRCLAIWNVCLSVFCKAGTRSRTPQTYVMFIARMWERERAFITETSNKS